MNLIQQAVERAGQMEREGKTVGLPPRPLGNLHGVQSRSFRPTPMNPSRAPLAALGLAVLAVVGGALLYVALVRSHGSEPAAVAPKLAQTNHSAQGVAVAKPAAVLPLAAPAPVPTPVAVVRAPTPPVPLEDPAINDAKATIESWARAWSERDVSGYLAHYGDGFTPARGASRAAWEKNRRQMIQRRRSIAVNVADLRLEQVSDKRIVARYVQDYSADTYRETGTPKRLVLERESSGWRIVAEFSDKMEAGSS